MKVLIVLENDLYVDHFLTSGALAPVLAAHDCAIGITDAVDKRQGVVAATGLPVRCWKRNDANAGLIYWFNAVTARVKAGVSRTLEMKAERGWFELERNYPPELQPERFAHLPLSALRHIAWWNLQRNPGLVTALKETRPDWVLYPITGVEGTGMELVAESWGRYRTMFLVNGWDNLSSKGVFPLLPDLLGVWGPQQAEDAVRVQEAAPESLRLVGCARYEPYFQGKGESPFPKQLKVARYALFAGSQLACDELTPLRVISDALPDGLTMVYRPHPRRVKRQCADLFPAGGFGRVVMDPEREPDYYRSKADGTEGDGAHHYTDLSYLVGLVSHAEFVVSPLSSMTLEAGLFDVPAVILANDESHLPESQRHMLPPNLQSRYTHFQGGREIEGWYWADTLDDLGRLVAGKLDGTGLRERMRRFLYWDERAYGQRVLEAIG